MEMWRLISNIILILNSDIVTANYFLNRTEVTWKQAQTICSVPSVDDIVYTEKMYSGLPTNFSAWTSSVSVKHKSDWTNFHGCLDVNQKIINNKTTLDQYFRNSIGAIKVNSVFECAYLCTKRTDYFTFVKYICKCIHWNEMKSALKTKPVCFKPGSTNHIDDVYSISHSALPVFKFETDFRSRNIQRRYNGKYQRYHCLGKRDGYFTIYDCNYSMEYYCADNFLLGRGNWSLAINKCLVREEKLLKDLDKLPNGWLNYFMYEEVESNHRCVAILRKDGYYSLTYQYRNCSDRLPTLCKKENHSPFERSFKPTSANVSDVPRSGDNKTFGELVVVNVALFGMCILSILMIILRKRLNLQFFQRTNQKSRRNTINRNPIVQTDGNSTGNDTVPINEINDVRDSFTEPLELHHNIVHKADLYQQDIIDVQTEETET